MKKTLKIIGLSLLLASLLLTIMWIRGVKERKNAASLQINDVDFSLLEDGTYHGYYEGGIHGYRENAVEISISDGKLVQIVNTLDGENKGYDFLEEIYQKVLDKQSLDIDATSGATLTTKAYLKSIEDAFYNEN